MVMVFEPDCADLRRASSGGTDVAKAILSTSSLFLFNREAGETPGSGGSNPDLVSIFHLVADDCIGKQGERLVDTTACRQ